METVSSGTGALQWDAAYELYNGAFRETQRYLSSAPINVIDSLAISSCSCRCRFLLNQPHQSYTGFLWDEETNRCVSFNLFLMIMGKNRYVFNRGIIYDILQL